MSQLCTSKLTTFLYILNYKCIIYTYAQTPFYEDQSLFFLTKDGTYKAEKWILHTAGQP